MANKLSLRDRNKADVLKRPNWEYRFEVASVKGRRKFITHGGFCTKKEALAAGTLAMQEYIGCGHAPVKATGISVADYLDLWFEKYCVTNLKYNTQLNYRSIIDNHLKPRFGIFRLSALSTASIQDYADSLSLNGYSKSHIKGILSTLFVALNYAIQPLGLLQSNPMQYVRFPSGGKPKRARGLISKEDFDRLLERFPFGNRYHIPLLLGWYCGMRISESFALTWDDIDFQNKTIRIEKQILKRFLDVSTGEMLKTMNKKNERTGWYFASPKYDSKRTILIGDHLLEVLKKEKARQEENEKLYDDYYTVQVLVQEKDEKGQPMQRLVSAQKFLKPSLPRIKLLCVDSNGQYTSTDSFRYAGRVARLELGIFLEYHALRHTHATILIENGVSPKVVQERLGHRTIVTTLQTYTHKTPTMESQAVKLFDSVAG